MIPPTKAPPTKVPPTKAPPTQSLNLVSAPPIHAPSIIEELRVLHPITIKSPPNVPPPPLLPPPLPPINVLSTTPILSTQGLIDIGQHHQLLRSCIISQQQLCIENANINTSPILLNLIFELVSLNMLNSTLLVLSPELTSQLINILNILSISTNLNQQQIHNSQSSYPPGLVPIQESSYPPGLAIQESSYPPVLVPIQESPYPPGLVPIQHIDNI